VKLDELIHAVRAADDTLLDLEELDDDELDAIRDAYQQKAAAARDAKAQKSRGPGAPRRSRQAGRS